MNKLILLTLILITSTSMADSRSFDRTWIGIFSKKQIAENYFFWTELQSRLDNDESVAQQIMIRPGVLRKIDEKNEIGLLYAYVPTGQIKEHRPTLQYSHIFVKNEVNMISVRNRFEYRKREDLETASGRYRAAIRWQKFLEKNLSIVLWDEPFLNITSEEWTGKRVFERNRLFVGTGFKLAENILEVGYMNQFVPRKLRDTYEHIITLYFFY